MKSSVISKWFAQAKYTNLIGVIGGALATLLGGWSAGMQTLVILMCIDYFCGIVVAGVFKKSKKTKDGALESRAGWKGLCRKIFTLALVAVAAQLESFAHTTFIRDAVVAAFCANESLSIIENAGLMGIPVPEQLKHAVEVLRNQSDEISHQH